MTTKSDQEIEALARSVFEGPLHIEPISGGLFNRVIKISTIDGIRYLKKFSDEAMSGSFPPLPTTATQRCIVATAWHGLSLIAARNCPSVEVPQLLSTNKQLDLLIMEEVDGQPLYEWLITSHDQSDVALNSVIDWLAVLHGLDLEPRSDLLQASSPFKAFKIDLQYTKVLPEIPLEQRPACENFIADYLSCNSEPVHGDINSRNILESDASIAVIDFEQGHFGEGVYDLAYIVSEYVIHSIRLGADPLTIIESAWKRYAGARSLDQGILKLEQRFRQHLSFQTLYRLIGPSRQVWTGHLDNSIQTKVHDWSKREATTWFK